MLVQRDFTRSYAVLRKIETMINEANPDLTVTHDTGCVTTLDKSQFAAKAHDRKVGVPVLSDAQVAALAMAPATLAAAADVDWTVERPDGLPQALQVWGWGATEAGTLADIVHSWWETFLAVPTEWSVALAALDRMLP